MLFLFFMSYLLISSHFYACEILEETVINPRLFVDKLSSCLAEAGDILLSIKEGIITDNHILGEIGELLNRTKPGRQNNYEITLSKSV